MPSIKTVTIVGVGLIGGSFALALRRVGYRGRILGVSSQATLARACARSVIDEGRLLREAVSESDLVYMAQPVPVIVQQLEQVRAHAPRHALVTDAGSTKRVIVERARELFDGGPDFVGGHPMAGKEGRGVEIAEAGLFAGATYALVPTGPALPESPILDEFLGWLDEMGCRKRVMDSVEHDRVVGWTSHVPQLVATGLAATIGGGLAGSGDLEIAGEGLRDMTRLAASPYEVWAGILQTNQGAIDDALGAFINEMEALRAALQDAGGLAGVAYEMNGEVIGEVQRAPYRLRWTAEPGTYSLRAIATDRAGNQTASDPVTFTVR